MTGKRASTPLLASITLAAAALIGAATPTAAATSAPAAIPAQPEVSTSMYIDAQPTSNVLDELGVYGIDQGNQDCVTWQGTQGFVGASQVYLDFGAQDASGQGTWSTVGPIGGASTPYYTNSWIEQAVEAFAEGYDLAANNCSNNNANESIYTNVDYGTNSSGGSSITSAQAAAQADSWLNIGVDAANAVETQVADNSSTESDDASIGPAIDIEPSFDEPPSTVEAWGAEISADQGSQSLPIDELNYTSNYGSADGCPTGGLTDSSQCNNGWTSGDLRTLSYDDAIWPSPEIYVQPQDQQWTAFCVYFDSEEGYSPLDNQDILSAPPTSSNPGTSGDLSTLESWDDITGDLQATGNSDCETQLPIYETTMENDVQS